MSELLALPEVPPPPPWRPVESGVLHIGGVLGIGFAPHPESGAELLLVASTAGRGLFDATGTRLARDRDEDAGYPHGPDLACDGIGPLAGTRVRMAGLYGGGLHTLTDDRWRVDVIAPAWPDERVVLSRDGDRWVVFDADVTELRTAGFSPSGRTLVAATSSDVTLWTR
ncbi:hypothetical protein EWH70_20685 [Amycolatopsis suaedae]|uniref:WD40 repeat domain-containing protein n=2 Tax=Amycolatopsis suaedae TaxID=2510978 RepID=A0A4Q7J5P8_9PSEU|nr:hypothetical protein EWH70_20685 [Amycolatopsis suaedae]